MIIVKFVAECSYCERYTAVYRCINLAKENNVKIELIVYKDNLKNKVKLHISKNSVIEKILSYIEKNIVK